MQESSPKQPAQVPGKSLIGVDLVALYLFFSVVGMVMEGLNSIVFRGGWETHVVSMIGPFCVIYGFGAVLYYLLSLRLRGTHPVICFFLFGAVGTVFELLCGLLLLNGLGMRAWDYSADFLNYKGLICPMMFAAWGAMGLAFYLLLPKIRGLLAKLHRQPFICIAGVLAVVLAVDLLFTGYCIYRWKRRRDGAPAVSAIERMTDRYFPDDYMQHRFIEWYFTEDADKPAGTETVADTPAQADS